MSRRRRMDRSREGRSAAPPARQDDRRVGAALRRGRARRGHAPPGLAAAHAARAGDGARRLVRRDRGQRPVRAGAPRAPHGLDLGAPRERLGRAPGPGAPGPRRGRRARRLARGRADRDVLHRVRRGAAPHPGCLRPEGFRLRVAGRGGGGLGRGLADPGRPRHGHHGGARPPAAPGLRARDRVGPGRAERSCRSTSTTARLSGRTRRRGRISSRCCRASASCSSGSRTRGASSGSRAIPRPWRRGCAGWRPGR